MKICLGNLSAYFLASVYQFSKQWKSCCLWYLFKLLRHFILKTDSTIPNWKHFKIIWANGISFCTVDSTKIKIKGPWQELLFSTTNQILYRKISHTFQCLRALGWLEDRFIHSWWTIISWRCLKTSHRIPHMICFPVIKSGS